MDDGRGTVISALLVVWTLLLLGICIIRYRVRSRSVEKVIVTIGYEEKKDGRAVKRLEHDRVSGREFNLLLLSLITTVLLVLPLWVLSLLAFALLAKSACDDWRTHLISDFLLFAMSMICVAIGIRSNRVVVSIIVTVVMCLYETYIQDSDSFGGADVYVFLAALAYYGFFSWVIFVLLGSLFGLILKIVFWLTKRDPQEEAHITLLPALALSAICTTVIDTIWAEVYTLSWDDVVWLIHTLFAR